jgi:hypothetical protein
MDSGQRIPQIVNDSYRHGAERCELPGAIQLLTILRRARCFVPGGVAAGGPHILL